MKYYTFKSTLENPSRVPDLYYASSSSHHYPPQAAKCTSPAAHAQTALFAAAFFNPILGTNSRQDAKARRCEKRRTNLNDLGEE
jgi:hypothetical protein